MASTNKTPNINLSQFVASDKPAWLTDYNNDMSKIDAAVGTVEETVNTVVAEALTSVETAQTELREEIADLVQNGKLLAEYETSAGYKTLDFDGKIRPVYQKCVIYDNASTDNGRFNIPFIIDNLLNIHEFYGIQSFPPYWQPVPLANDSNIATSRILSWANNIIITGGIGISQLGCYKFVIKYTKTTDVGESV